MRLLPRSRFDLRPLPAASGAVPRSEILIDTRPTGVAIAGAVLEAGLSCEAGFLVFASDDIPYEESLHIYLLGEDLTVLDQATLGAPYTTGAFGHLQPLDRGTLQFAFFGDTRWTLRLHARGRFALPCLGEPRGVRRPWRWRRRFQLSGEPQPDTAA